MCFGVHTMFYCILLCFMMSRMRFKLMPLWHPRGKIIMRKFSKWPPGWYIIISLARTFLYYLVSASSNPLELSYMCHRNIILTFSTNLATIKSKMASNMAAITTFRLCFLTNFQKNAHDTSISFLMIKLHHNYYSAGF